MHFIRNFTILLLVVFVISSFIALAVTDGYFDHQIRLALEFYLKTKGIKADVGDFHLRRGDVFADKISLKLKNDTQAEITDLNVKFNISNILKQGSILALVDLGKLTLKNQSDSELFYGKISGELNLDLYNIELNTNVIFSNNTSTLSFNSKIQNNFISAHSKVSNIPIMLYKIIVPLVYNSELTLILDEYIKDGLITNGVVDINFDKEFFKTKVLTAKNLACNFNIKNLEIKYDKDFPALKNSDIDISVLGSSFTGQLHKAYTSNTLISGGILTLDWTGIDTSNFTAVASAKGSVVDLTDFIPSTAIDKTKKIGIDLRKFTGTANTKIKLTIPLSPKIKNSYDISSEVYGVGLKIFDEKIKLNGAKVKGLFNGDKVIISGNGKINGFDSNINYIYNIANTKDYRQLLKIQTNLQASDEKIAIIKVIKGSTSLDFEYKDKDSQDIITAIADLKKTEFYIDKIAVHKLYGEKANLNMKGNFKDNLNANIDFKLSGDENLNINGSIAFNNGNYKLQIPSIRHKQTSLKGDVNFNDNNFNARISGDNLDLSKADMMEFLQKEKEGTNIDLKIDIDNIQLKNDVKLTDFKLEIECDKVRCFNGSLDSKLANNKVLKMSLKPIGDKEEWIITSNNAGALFRGIGIYNNMRTGSMILDLKTRRKEVKKGEIIPILDGNFTFKNFAVVGNNFLTRLASFISLPGLKSLVTNNKDVIFKEMTGKFSYKNNIIKIKNSSAEGPFFDFTIEGTIDTNIHKLDLKGNVIPSLYGISTILRNIPILGKVLSGGHRKGIIFAPYSIRQSY